jgi:hypothetical protein
MNYGCVLVKRLEFIGFEGKMKSYNLVRLIFAIFTKTKTK